MKNDKRELILKSAEELMSATSVDDLSISRIAKNAGIGKGSVYYYFQSKEEIIGEVISNSYKRALSEYFSDMKSDLPALEKIKRLFLSTIKKQFDDNRKNLIISLNLHDSPMLHNKMKLTAIEVVSPVLSGILHQGIKEGTIKCEAPEESAEMIVAVISFLFDSTIFSADEIKKKKKLNLLANVLETCLKTEPGSFDFLSDVYS